MLSIFFAILFPRYFAHGYSSLLIGYFWVNDRLAKKYTSKNRTFIFVLSKYLTKNYR
ncbi:hypothetical protein STRPS_1784 [Streptococcus pseudoporcinus LQ 940-04]|uniref:Uncharacterized protein n=1 Tax=Streptococcus pseudoporcinus LQ 940-04 TaxID=875093 RepID=G5KBR2_9STRE|nr:hypothetical protein STRPS_1784 [Streptococcus pseudoporcinus LQ 940-04]